MNYREKNEKKKVMLDVIREDYENEKKKKR